METIVEAGTCVATTEPSGGAGDTARVLADLCDQRAALYGLVSRLFIAEMDEDFLAEMRKTPFPASTGDASIDRGYALIVSYLSRHGADAVHDLAVDYVRTFVGSENTAHSAAYPFESVYTSEKRLLMQEARDEVAAILKSEGLGVGPDWRDPEDHIAIELQYMQTMSVRSVVALRAGREEDAWSLLTKQRNFMEDHLLPWVPMMVEDMRKKAQSDFYQGLSYLVEGLLRTDADTLAAVLS